MDAGVRFGVFELDLRARELRRRGVRLRVPDQSLKVLALLLEHRGEVVTREEIQEKLWPDGTIVDFEHSVNSAVARLREALGDSANSPRYVETLPRRGYRFVVPVQDLPMADAGLEKKEEGKQARPASRRWAWGAAGLALATALAGGWKLIEGGGEAEEVTITAVTRDAGLTTDPAISPDGKTIAYASDRAGSGDLDLWVQPLEGGPAARITSDPVDERDPCFSPDGARIVFRSEKDGGGIYTIGAAGGVARRVAPLGRSPQYSRDGKWIAYWVGMGAGEQGARSYVVSMADHGPPRRIFAELERASVPVWSSDGRWISVIAPGGQRPEAWVAPFDAETGATGGAHAMGLSQLKTVTLLAATWPAPIRWMPDNRTIIFSALGNGVANLFRTRVSGDPPRQSGEVRRLTYGSGKEMPFQPVGKLVPFVGLTRSYDLWAVPLDAVHGRIRGAPRQITQGGVNDWPSAALDGSRLAYVSTRYGQGEAGYGGLYSIVVREIRSGSEAVIPVLAAPLLGPNGRRMVYRYLNQIYAVDFGERGQSGRPRLVCAECGQPMGFTPDGNAVIHRTAEGLSLVDLETGENRPLLKWNTTITEARISPDNRWMAIEEAGTGVSRLRVGQFSPALATGPEWRAVTDGQGWDDKPRWSPDSRLLYFLSDRDGFRCIWAQRIDTAGKCMGNPFAVLHSHESRSSLLGVNPRYAGLEVARDKLIYVSAATTGNILLARPGGHPGVTGR